MLPFRWGFSSSVVAFLFLFLQGSTPILAERSKTSSPWKTLSGSQPVVIARGGLSGVFPDSSEYAYSIAMQTSLPDVNLWCDVQLTKDGYGICLPDVKIDNCTAIRSVYGNETKKYIVNGELVSGLFSVDFTYDQLSNIPLIQGIYSRTEKFDGMLPIITVEYLEKLNPPGLWLNIQRDLFYNQHKLSMRSYVLSISRNIDVNYISSPEVAFLRSIARQFKAKKTKLVFRFLGADMIEPSTNQTYASLLKNLTFVRTFASGILIPKDYIWPVSADLYLQPHTSLVLDAHKKGLEVFASDFANDAVIAYNYSYNPISEYISFIDNGEFSVDGFLSDYPITASEAIGCFSHLNKNVSGINKLLVISHNGASGTFPDCTDLAYKQAVEDGTDVIDCTVQVTKDGILICLGSIDLIDGTSVTKSPFSTRSIVAPEIQSEAGIFTFNLTWEEIEKNLKPTISNPDFSGYKLMRNPEYRNAGTFMRLADFLAFAKNSRVSGILIKIEHAAFIVKSIGFNITDSVLKELNDSGFNNQTSKEVMIQSTNSSVLIDFKQKSQYRLVYEIDELIGDVDSSSIRDIKKFANSVAVKKESIFPKTEGFITSQTKLVEKLHSANLSVYVYGLKNEFVSQPWDFFSDPMVEINNYFQGASVDGLIMDFPRTATAYKKNTCLKEDKIPNYMLPVQPGGLLSLIATPALPPALAPFPALTESDVIEPPLPSATGRPLNDGAGKNVTSPHGGVPRISSSILACVVMFFSSFMLA